MSDDITPAHAYKTAMLCRMANMPTIADEISNLADQVDRLTAENRELRTPKPVVAHSADQGELFDYDQKL
jgi:hypothetical protein